MKPPLLFADVVRCFVVDYSTIDDAMLPHCATILDEEERARASRFLFERDRRSFVISHAFLRSILSLHAEVPPEAWRFSHGSHGKPEIATPEVGRAMRFNLSHTRGAAVVAVGAGGALGVDIETIGRDASCVDLADRFFSPLEVTALRALPEVRQRDRFFEYWTLKEAYIKARGLGLAIPLDRFSYRISATERPTISFADGFDDTPANWRFASWQPLPIFQAAVAVQLAAADGVRFEYCLTRPFDTPPASFTSIA